MLGGVWGSPLLISGYDEGKQPLAWRPENKTLVSYRTPWEMVTIEITIFESAGGSDDIDVGTVQATEESREFLVSPY